jgi:hypothetical protein
MGSPGKGGGGKGGGGKGLAGKGGGGKGGGKGLAGKGGGGKGGGKGLAGKGGGGKGGGKGGGGGPSSQAVFGFSKQVLDKITAAIAGATPAAAGVMRVALDLTTAQQLLASVALGLNLSICPGKKKGKSG